jgi:hypothetical protein
MNSDMELLALRKQVLVARVTLQRLEAAAAVGELRDSFRWPRAAAAIAGSTPGRSLLASLLLLVARRGGFARIAGVAGVALALIQLARSFDRFQTGSQRERPTENSR